MGPTFHAKFRRMQTLTPDAIELLRKMWPEREHEQLFAKLATYATVDVVSDETGESGVQWHLPPGVKPKFEIYRSCSKELLQKLVDAGLPYRRQTRSEGE